MTVSWNVFCIDVRKKIIKLRFLINISPPVRGGLLIIIFFYGQ